MLSIETDSHNFHMEVHSLNMSFAVYLYNNPHNYYIKFQLYRILHTNNTHLHRTYRKLQKSKSGSQASQYYIIHKSLMYHQDSKLKGTSHTYFWRGLNNPKHKLNISLNLYRFHMDMNISCILRLISQNMFHWDNLICNCYSINMFGC